VAARAGHHRIIKHTADGMRGVIRNLENDLRVAPMKPGDVERYMAGFALVEGETSGPCFAEFDAAAGGVPWPRSEPPNPC